MFHFGRNLCGGTLGTLELLTVLGVAEPSKAERRRYLGLLDGARAGV